jgi:NhaP-type Na+/H+ and K+/H+ antiporter
MNEALAYAAALCSGAAAGILFFGGLKMTVRKMSGMKHPALFVLLSFWGRLLITTGMAAAVAKLFGWQPVLLFVGMFICVKLVFVITAKRKVHDQYTPNA